MRKLILLCFSLALASCSPWVRGDQPAAPDRFPLGPDPLGQTFVARHAGLEGLEFYIEPDGEIQGELSLTLHPDPGLDEELARAQVAAPEEPGFYRFSFPQLSGAYNAYYYARLAFEGSGRLLVGAAPGDAYLDGAAYLEETPMDAQLAFRTLYDPWGRVAGLLRMGGRWLWIGLLAGLVYLLPGWALLAFFWPKDLELPWFSRAALASGVGLAIYPVLFLFTDMAGVHPGPVLAWGVPAAAALALAGRRFRGRDRKGEDHDRRDHKGPAVREVLANLRRWWTSEAHWPDLAFLLISGLLVASRFYPVARLEAPMWGDSYQHSVIVQLILERGGLFDSWEPYAEMTALTYHFGFHAQAAVLAWVTGLRSPDAVLWAGQIVNVLAVIGLYPLAARISGSRWGGVLAVLAAGLLAPMPMAYVNWGRYTQLAGQAVLLPAIFAAWAFLDRDQMGWRLTTLVWLLWAGLALSHYRVLIFAVLFFPAYLLLHPGRQAWWRSILRTLALGLGAGLIFLPWFLHLFAGRIIDMLASQLTTPPASSSVWHANNAFDFSTYGQYLAPGLWALAAAAGLYGLLRRRRALAWPLIWWTLIFLAANPHWLRLPGVGALSNFAVFIAIYIPAGLLIGGGGGALVRAFGRDDAADQGSRRAPTDARDRVTRPAGALLLILVLAAGAWGARQSLGDVDAAGSALVTRPDLRAASWIEQELPDQARFHVNQFFAFSDSVTVGSDGGWWLPLLARRATDLPPINYGFERPPYPGYSQWVNALPAMIRSRGVTSPEVLAEFRARGITHVYLGQRQGRVNYAGPDRLDPATLLADPNFTPIYHQDRVWIFEIAAE